MWMQWNKNDAKNVRVNVSESHYDGLETGPNEKTVPDNRRPPLWSALPWKMLLACVGSFILALLTTVCHYIFFKVLDGKDSSASSLRQPQVSLISLLLITVFRASILTSLGASFAQYLWYLLRSKTLRVSLIESLFRVRSNAFELLNLKLARHAPILLLAAALSWVVGLATIYPPGALVIHSEPNWFLTKVNASIMNPPSVVDSPIVSDGTEVFWTPKTLAKTIGRAYLSGEGAPGSPGATKMGTVSTEYRGPSLRLQSLARLIMSTGQITTLNPLGTANSSCGFTFEGPQVRCQSRPVTNVTVEGAGWNYPGRDEVLFNSTWLSAETPVDSKALVLSSDSFVGYYPVPSLSAELCDGNPCFDDRPENATLSMIVERHVLECDAFKAMYKAKIRYERGIQQVTYEVKEIEKFQFTPERKFEWDAAETSNVPNTTQAYGEFTASVKEWIYEANIRAVMDALGTSLAYTWRGSIIGSIGEPIGTFKLSNGSDVPIASAVFSPSELTKNYTILEDSILNSNRFVENATAYYEFDPRESLDITEKSINELLANISISALSLNTWYDMVEVNNTEFRNVYHFSNPKHLLLPYGLCLAATLVFVGIGLNALRLNGVSATDGGFLQILMTTTGDTAINRAAAKGALMPSEEAPRELRDMKVRFARLVETSGVAFGTAEETTALERKGWRTKV